MTVNGTEVNQRRWCLQQADALLGRELLVLQLLARGYSLAQIECLLGHEGEAHRALRRAGAVLGVQEPNQAPAEAQRLGLVI